LEAQLTSTLLLKDTSFVIVEDVALVSQGHFRSLLCESFFQPDLLCIPYLRRVLLAKQLITFVSEYGSLKIIGDSVYSEFLVATEVPRLALAVQHQLSLDSNDIMEPTGISEEGMDIGPMPSPASVAPPLDDEDELTKGAEENRNTTTVPPVTMSQSTDGDPPEDGNPGGGGVGPSTGGSKEDAIDVDKIAATAEDNMIYPSTFCGRLYNQKIWFLPRLAPFVIDDHSC
jgi:hypothetical protein